MIPSAIPGDHTPQASQLAIPAASCEVVAAAVLRAGRTSARITEAALAAGCGIDEATLHSWENGAQPLTTVPAPQLDRMKGVLLRAGAEPGIVADLDTAAWCDLVVLAIADCEDCTGLLADPLTAERPFRELLTWALTGRIPDRYTHYVLPGTLITHPALAERAIAALRSIRPDLLPRRT